MKDWVQNILNDDEGIAELCKCLCGLKYKESNNRFSKIKI